MGDESDEETSGSDNLPTDPEAVLSVPADGDLEVTTANNTHHKFTDSEMILEDCDPEGWENVESDTLEGNIYDDDPEDDFGDIYSHLSPFSHLFTSLNIGCRMSVMY